MKMYTMIKRLFLTLGVGGAVLLGAGESKALKTQFDREKKELTAKNDKAFTTMEITDAAGEAKDLALSQMLRAVEFKLKNCSNQAERNEVFELVMDAGGRVQKVFDMPSSGGSLESYMVLSEVDSVYSLYTRIMLLNDAEYARWKRISNSVVTLGTKTIRLKNGYAEFMDKAYDNEVKLVTDMNPAHVFNCGTREFALLIYNVEKTLCDDYLRLFLCEYKNDELVVLYDFGFESWVKKFEFKDNVLKLDTGHRKVSLKLAK